MSTETTWSPSALKTCVLCGSAWAILLFAGCGFVVFGLGQSGWWFVPAFFLAAAWSCKSYRSPEQMAADKEDD